MKPTHFLATDEWSDERILTLLDRAHELRQVRGGEELRGRVLGLVFFNPSLRTRSSFEVAMLRHGGSSLVLEPGKGVWGMETRDGVVMDGAPAEHIREAARVLSRYVDGLGVRAFPAGDDLDTALADPVVRGFAGAAEVPVINLESARRHPCQGLADAMTLEQRLGPRPRGAKFTLAWCWHPSPLPTAVPVSALIAAGRLGMDLTLAHPPGWDLPADDIDAARAVAERCGGSLRIEHDLDTAVSGADAVYAKSWGNLSFFGDPDGERAARRGLRSWRIDGDRMRMTNRGSGAFLHCLPVRRNVVVTDEVLDGPWSVVVDQAENRLHAQRALLLELLA